MRCVFTAIIACILFAAAAQESPYAKFGKVTPDALLKKTYDLDSSAGAVVLSDIGQTSIEGNYKGWFSVYTTRHKVVQILSRAAYDEANVEIPLYSDGDDEEKLEYINAVTYNLEGGKVVATKVDKSDVFTERRNKHLLLKKFTFPAVKEGSIIEYQYKVSSDFLNNIDPWNFQGSMPVLWSEYVFSVPEFFSYLFLTQGYSKPFLKVEKSHYGFFTVHPSLSAMGTPTQHIRSRITDKRWVFKGVPGFKAEDFTTAPANHIAKLEFQLVSRNKPLAPDDYRQSWTDLTKELMEEYGLDEEESNTFFSGDVKKIIGNARTETEKAKRLFAFVRDHFVCTSFAGISLQQSPKAAFKSGKGTAAELNILLTLLLRSAGIQAHPVILSTTDHGYTLEDYPFRNRFNYVVTRVLAGGTFFYLDASHNHLGFGRLLPACYNGHARVVNEEASPVFLSADSLRDAKLTTLFLANGKERLWEGNMTQRPGYCESYEWREWLKAEGTAPFLEEKQAAFGSDATIANGSIDSLNDYDNPIAFHCDVAYNPLKDDILFVNPMFGEGYKTNPFKSTKRLYPVEMPYATDETFSLTMEVPEGYAVEELPKQVRAKFDEAGNVFFEYLVQSSGGFVSLRSRLKIGRTFFAPEEYESLREFFNLVVKKQNEQLVFRKN